MKILLISSDLNIQASISYMARLCGPFDAGGVGIERRENAGVVETALKFSICGIPNWGNIIEIPITLALIIIL